MTQVFALGVALARRGVVPTLALVFSALTVIAMIILAIVFGLRGPQSPLHDLPLVASSALAWGGGFLLAFGAAPQAFLSDRKDGVRHLLVFRTTSLRGYLLARIGGLAILIALIVAGGTLLVGLTGMLTTRSVPMVVRTLQSTVAGVLYAMAFALVITPVAFASFGKSSRFWGYITVLSVLVGLEVVAELLSALLPSAVTELIAIPSALAALRASLMPGKVDLLRFARALVAILAMSAIAIAVVRRKVIDLETTEPDA